MGTTASFEDKGYFLKAQGHLHPGSPKVPFSAVTSARWHAWSQLQGGRCTCSVVSCWDILRQTLDRAAVPRLHLRNNTDGQKEEFVEFHMPAAESL